MADITVESVQIVGGRRGRGRPRAAEPRIAVTAWVPVSVADQLVHTALKHDVSVSAVMGTLLKMCASSAANFPTE